MLHLAMLKRPLPGVGHWLAHHLGAALDQSRYSHSNLVFANGLSGSAWADRGVDLVHVDYELDRWDFYTLPGVDEAAAHRDLMHLRGTRYDRLGCLRFGLPLLREHPDWFFCHELAATLFGWTDPWRVGPGTLVARCIDVFGAELVPEPFSESVPGANGMKPSDEI